MAAHPPAQLLTTRLRAAIAAILTGYVLFLAVHGPLFSRYATASSWPFDGLLHGWTRIVANVMIYCWVYWIVFWFVRGTQGRERIVMIGWALASVMSPLRRLLPALATVARSLEGAGLAVALAAAVSLLAHPTAKRARSKEEVADLIERFLRSKLAYPQEWNDFVECSQPDPAVDAYRKRCYELDPLVNRPAPSDQDAVSQLRSMADELRADTHS